MSKKKKKRKKKDLSSFRAQWWPWESYLRLKCTRRESTLLVTNPKIWISLSLSACLSHSLSLSFTHTHTHPFFTRPPPTPTHEWTGILIRGIWANQTVIRYLLYKQTQTHTFIAYNTEGGKKISDTNQFPILEFLKERVSQTGSFLP